MIIVVGLPGSGTTSVIKGLNTDYQIVNYGNLMFEIEKEKFGVKNRDEMRKLPIEKQKEAQRMVYEHLSQMGEKVILDTHSVVNTSTGYFPGLPFEYLKMLKVERFIHITAHIEEIAQRRASDPTRKRDVDNIALHEEMNRSFLAAYSAFTGAPVAIIFNTQGKLQETIEKVQALLG
jgi:adenylate kinase